MIYFVFDVESIGLHGEAFAVGWTLVSNEGVELTSGLVACPRATAKGNDDDRTWVDQNIPHLDWNELGPREVRDRFWGAWMAAKKRGAVMASDCGWPVEARFLAACVDDDPEARRWDGPYPLHDLASLRLAAGLDPLGANERLPSELPAHNPLADARQSARLLIEALAILQGRQEPGDP